MKYPTFKVGDKVKLRADVLQRHARSVPAHMGYTREQFAWRNTLRKLLGLNEQYKVVAVRTVGVIERIFPNSGNVNVQFPETMIGIDATELEAAG